MQPLFESWSLASPPVPPRSALYSIEPVGIGTSFVEGLTSYIARLAEEHAVSVGDLVGRVLSDLASPHDPIITQAAKSVRIGGHGFRACSYALNGVSDQAAKWSHALEIATSRRNLRFLTLLPLQSVLPDHLFHNHRAWCALCFEDWRTTGQVVYEPLLWGIKVSTHCPIHARALDYACPQCGRTLNPLGVFSRPGCCERCGAWLGVANADRHLSQPRRLSGEDYTHPCRPAPTLADLGHRLGYSTSAVLRAHEPGLCDQLARRRRAQVSKRRADLKTKAEAALLENPVPSVRDLCDRLRITMWFMETYFPDLKRAIAGQHRRCVSAETTRRREKLLQNVRDVVSELRSQGLYPSINRIVERLPEGSCRTWKSVTWAIREARDALSISR